MWEITFGVACVCTLSWHNIQQRIWNSITDVQLRINIHGYCACEDRRGCKCWYCIAAGGRLGGIPRTCYAGWHAQTVHWRTRICRLISADPAIYIGALRIFSPPSTDFQWNYAILEVEPARRMNKIHFACITNFPYVMKYQLIKYGQHNPSLTSQNILFQTVINSSVYSPSVNPPLKHSEYTQILVNRDSIRPR